MRNIRRTAVLLPFWAKVNLKNNLMTIADSAEISGEYEE
jgi:hypothetical protein